MEIRWHLSPGQTFENTRISDLKTELHITTDKWRKITQKLDRRNLKAEAIAKERARRQQMREENQAMIDSWEDSLMVTKQKEIITF